MKKDRACHEADLPGGYPSERKAVARLFEPSHNTAARIREIEDDSP